MLRTVIGALACICLGTGYAKGDDVLALLRAQDKLGGSGDVTVRYAVRSPAGAYNQSSRIQYLNSDYVITTKTPSQTIEEWTEGDWRLSATANSNVVSVRSRDGGMFRLDPMGSPQGLGPQFCQGRGLSNCREVSFARDRSDVTLKGKLGSYRVCAKLAPEADYCAREIRCYLESPTAPVLTFRNQEFRTAKGGYIYASRSVADRKTITQEFQTAFTPLQGELPKKPWLQVGSRVAEDRVEPGIMYTYDEIIQLAGGTKPSLDKLFEISERQRHMLDNRKAKDQLVVSDIEARPSREAIWRGVQFCFAGTLFAGSIVYSRRAFRRK